MSRRQAEHFRLISKRKDRKLVKLAHKLRALQRAWRQPEPFYNTRRDEIAPPTSGWQLERWNDQNGRCAYCCGSLWPRYHYDHIIPKSKGGSSHPSNFAIACEPCNLSKNDKDAISFALYLLSSI